MNTADVLAGIAAATDDAAMPRVVDTFPHPGLGDVDPDRWVPGRAELLPGGRVVAYSTRSARAALRNARRVRA